MSTVIQQITGTIKNWWLFLLFGVLLIVFAIWIFMTPLESYVGLAFAFSFLVFANGISHIYFSISNRQVLEGWGWYLANGIMELLIGLVLIIYPELSVTSLPFIVGFWLMFKSGFIIGTAFDLRRYGVLDWGYLLLLGITVGILSFVMILHPVFGAFTIVGWTATAFLFFGITNIMLGLKLKKIKSMTFDKVDELKAKIIKEAAGFKEHVMSSLQTGLSQAGDDTAKIKKEVEGKVDDFVKNLGKES